jgi:hypothetical protein
MYSSSFRKDNKKDDESGSGGASGTLGAYANLERSSVLQEAKQRFNETPVNVRKCTTVMAKILYLLHQVAER